MSEIDALDEISTKSLVRAYGKRTVVNDVNISINAAEVVGLLGPNGAGKTTTFYMIVGLIVPTSGAVYLNENSLNKFPMHKRARMGIAYLPQEPSIFRKMTVEQNIRAVAETLSLSKSQRNACVEEHLNELGLEHLANQKAYTLSGGERRRLEISRALIAKPKFLLMDEPFSGVDPISVSDVQNIIIQLKKKGIGVLITDHNVRETLRIVDRAYLLHEGSILSSGTSEFLINDQKSREFYLGNNFNL
ncbi:MAG: LPS export ABC transporter ATP-binding protein [Puniceicoccaceae bacterium]|nr:LPS export ABC transporter ATP-binding protein [Puniceicoccaceae bacterium]